MSSRPFFLKKVDEYKNELERELRKNSIDYEVIIKRWSLLQECVPEDEEEHTDQVKADILLVVSSLGGSCDLIRHLNLVLPLGFNVSCYPSDPKNTTSRTKYFALLSNPYGSPWGEIFPTTQDSENDQPLEPCVSMHELNIAIGRKASWEDMVKASESGGWSGCLLDMLTWEIQSMVLERGFKEMAIRIQAELAGRLKQLPFTTYHDLPESIQTRGPAPDGPSKSCYESVIAGQELWVQIIDVGESFDQKANLEGALALMNFRHPRLVAWTSVYSIPSKTWYLVTHRGRITNLETFYKRKWTKSNRFKLNTLGDIGEAALPLKTTWSWRKLGMADIFVDTADANRCYASHSSLADTPSGGAYARDEDMAKALNIFYLQSIGEIARKFYDSEVQAGLSKEMKVVARFVCGMDKLGTPWQIKAIKYNIDIQIKTIPPEDMVEPEEEEHSQSDSDATLVSESTSPASTSRTLTPTGDSPVSPSGERKKKGFSLFSRKNKAGSPKPEPQTVNGAETPVGPPKKTNRISRLFKR